MNDKEKLIKKIIHIEEKIWSPMSVSKPNDFDDRDENSLKKYLRAVEIVCENSTKENPVYVKCDKCGKYLGQKEIDKGKTCIECLGENWF